MPLPPLAFFRDDLRMSTWLLIGASLQCVLCLVLPVYVAHYRRTSYPKRSDHPGSLTRSKSRSRRQGTIYCTDTF